MILGQIFVSRLALHLCTLNNAKIIRNAMLITNFLQYKLVDRLQSQNVSDNSQTMQLIQIKVFLYISLSS